MSALTVHGPLVAAAQRAPRRQAVISDGGGLTYGELDARSRQLAGALRADLGLEPGARVGLLCGQSPRFYVGLLAIARAGLTLVPIPARATERELDHLVADSSMRAMLVDEAVNEELLPHVTDLADAGLEACGWGEDLFRRRSVQQLIERTGSVREESVDEDSPFFFGYTSGTTGRPKAAVVSHRARAALMLLLGQEYGCYHANAHHLIATPLYHGAGMLRGIAPLAFGGCVTLHPRFEPERCAKTLDSGQVDATFVVPTMFAAIEELGVEDSAPHRVTLLSNASALPERLKTFALSRWPQARLFEIYGSTETGTVASLRPPDQLRKERCVGPPLAFNSVKLLDAAHEPVEVGEVGELFVANPFLFDGYFGNDDATQAAFRGGYVTVGDLARADEEGYLYIVGRKVDVIITGGVNIYPREVEEVLREHPGVSDAAVFGIADERWGEAVRAVVELVGHPPSPLDHREALEGALIEHCRARLAPAKVPKSIAAVDRLPRTPAGKVKKAELTSSSEVSAQS